MCAVRPICSKRPPFFFGQPGLHRLFLALADPAKTVDRNSCRHGSSSWNYQVRFDPAARHRLDLGQSETTNVSPAPSVILCADIFDTVEKHERRRRQSIAGRTAAR